ncbi:MAG: hypothetical protein JJU06_12955 [Ectothiorhodospiraceae bacterium]|nr:hypothetical protein [Ectothiorhodospiraceae bacterium]
MLRRLALATALTLTAFGTQATELEIAVSDAMAEIKASGRTSQTSNQATQFGGSVLYNEDKDLLGSLFLQINNRVDGRWQPVTFGIGTKLWVGSLDRPDEDFIALGIGGDVGIGIPAQIPMAIVLQGYISPNITTSGDTDRVTEGMIRLEAEITRGAHAFLGYRQIQARSSDYRNVRIDDGLHVGIRLRF